MSTVATMVVKVVADTTGAIGGLKAVDTAVGRMGASMSRVGSTLTRSVTLPLALVGGASIKAAIDFESAFAGVRKTVDATEGEFRALESGIRDMSKRLPASAVEISAVAEAAGQLGIQTKSILGFTRTMIDLGESTDMTADQAATGLARIANITQMPQDQFDRLGSTVVDLGNKGAATEAEIVSFGLRIAGAGKIAELTQANILSIGEAFSSVGVPAERGGTAVQKVLFSMTSAVNEGGAALQTFAKTAAMSSDEFAARWEADPAQAFTAFVEGLGRAGKAGESILRDLELTDQRLIQSFLSLAGAGDLLRTSIETGNKAWEENTALTTEAERRYATTESQLRMMKNQLVDAGVDIGRALIPALIKVGETVADMARAFSSLSPAMQENIVKWGLIAMAAGPVLRIFGSLLTVGGKLGGVLGFGGAASGGGLGVAAIAGRGFLAMLPPLIVGMKEHAEQTGIADEKAQGFAQALIAGRMSSDEVLASLERQKDALTLLTDEWFFAESPVITHAKALNIAGQEVVGLETIMRSLGIQLTEQQYAWSRVRMNAGDFGSVIAMMRGKVTDFWDVWTEGGPKLSGAIDALDAAGISLSAQKRALLAAAISSGDYNRAIGLLQGAIERLPKRVQTKIDIDTRGAKEGAEKTGDLLKTAQREAGATMEQLSKLARERVEPKVKLDTGPAQTAIANIKGQLKGIPDETVYVNIVPRGKMHAGGQIMHAGGMVPRMHAGGMVPRMHAGGLKGDEVPAILQRGEFVINRDSARSIGLSTLLSLNRMHDGGRVSTGGGFGSVGSLDAGTISAIGDAVLDAFRRSPGGTTVIEQDGLSIHSAVQRAARQERILLKGRR